MTETLMTEAATTNTEGQASSTDVGGVPPASASTEGTGEPATNVENQQAGEGTAESKTDTKPEDSSQGEGDKGQEGESSDSEGAPEEYADFDMPEGFQLQAEMTNDIKSVAKELNLTQEQAQKLADIAANRVQFANASQVEALKQAQTQWSQDSKADKEFGGDALNENLSVAKKALDQFGTPELRNLLNESGLGNHPEIIRAFYRAGKAISEDNHFVPSGAKVSQGQRDHAKALYPTQ